MKKRFFVVAYDIADDKRRYRVVKILESIASRINNSVFECMLSESRYNELVKQLEKIIDKDADEIVFYPICRRCYTKVKYLFNPSNKAKDSVISV